MEKQENLVKKNYKGIIYDLECSTFGVVSPYSNKLKLFGYLDLDSGEVGILNRSQREEIQEVLAKDCDKISYNGRGYDNIILRDNGYAIKGEVVDLLDIVRAKRHALGFSKFDKLSLANVAIRLGLDIGKEEIDYAIFDDDDLIKKHYDEVVTYLKRDLELTRQVYDYFYDTIQERKGLKQKLLSQYF